MLNWHSKSVLNGNGKIMFNWHGKSMLNWHGYVLNDAMGEAPRENILYTDHWEHCNMIKLPP